MWIGIVALAERHEPELFLRLMGFPDDLPDLASLQPPKGTPDPKASASRFMFSGGRGDYQRLTEKMSRSMRRSSLSRRVSEGGMLNLLLNAVVFHPKWHRG